MVWFNDLDDEVRRRRPVQLQEFRCGERASCSPKRRPRNTANWSGNRFPPGERPPNEEVHLDGTQNAAPDSQLRLRQAAMRLGDPPRHG
jgi:hypothetical protein